MKEDRKRREGVRYLLYFDFISKSILRMRKSFLNPNEMVASPRHGVKMC